MGVCLMGRVGVYGKSGCLADGKSGCLSVVKSLCLCVFACDNTLEDCR